MSSDFDRQELVGIFTSEASDGLKKLVAAVRPSDGSPPTQAAFHEQFIVAHSLKGAAALYGFGCVAGLAAILEKTCERVGDLPEDEWRTIAKFSGEIVDAICVQIDAIERSGAEDGVSVEALKSRYPEVTRLMQDMETPRADPDEKPLADEYLQPDIEAEVFSYFTPEAQEYIESMTSALLSLEKSSDDPQTIQGLYRAAHTLKGSAYTIGFQAIGDMAHPMEDLIGGIRDGRMRLSPELTDLFFRALDAIRLLLKRDPTKIEQTRKEFSAVIGQLRHVGGASAPAPASAVASTTMIGNAAEAAAEAKPAQKEERRPAATGGDGGVIRVSRDRLEHLLNLVGELVIGRSRLEQRLLVLEQLSRQVVAYEGRMLDSVSAFEEKHAFTLPKPSGEEFQPGSTPLTDFGALEFDKYDDFNILARSMAEISADVAESMSQLSGSIRHAREDMSVLQQLTLGLRDEIARARMVPFSTLFTRFERAVRETGRAAGKSVSLEVSGGHIELDTDVVQRLVDPLVHIVRNALYHGIESPEARVACGKQPAGTVYLRAAHRGSAVVIEVEDDGAGLDIDKIKAKAIAVGILRPERATTMADADVINLIYLPGFSTAPEVGDQAGRGVGMDVVKRAIQAINGQIDIETEKGVGTKFTLQLPLTLLISTALIVRVGDQRYALPLLSIREVLVPQPGAVQDLSGRSVLQVGDEAIDVRSLAQLIGTDAPAPEGPAPIVILRTPQGIQGVVVDELLGRQELVIKTLGALKLFKGSCYSGATIDPEGRVILVLDASILFGGRKTEASSLPLPPQSPQLEHGEAVEAGGFAAEPETTRILLIDDSLSIRKFVGRMLETAGYQVETAIDGEEGLRKAAAESYHLIITDLEMPKINGYEVIQALRDRPQTKTIPIIVMTTRVGEKHRQMALSLGATSYIAKPIEERALVREISRWVGGAAASARV